MDNKELIRKLLDDKGKLVSQQRELHSKLEASKEWSAEDEAQWTRYSEEIDDRTRRADHLFQMDEAERHNAEQREKFADLLGTPSAVADESKSLKTRMEAFMRTGLRGGPEYGPKHFEFDMPAPGSERMDLTKGVAAAGGNLVPTSFSSELMRHLVTFAAVRQTRSRVLTTAGGENLQIPKTTGYGSAAIVAEGGAIGESDQTFGQVTVGAFKYANMVQLSRELVEDEAVDITGELARVAGLQVGLANGTHLVTGTGSGQPQGVANAPVQGIGGNIANAAALSTDNLIDLFHGVNPGYRIAGEWLMQDATIAQIRKFKDTTNQYLWQPGLTEGQPDRLLGRPVIGDPNMARAGAGAALILFGDFNLFYTIRDARGVRFERSDDFAFANDLVSYRVILRTDAKQVLNDTTNSAVKAIILTA